MNVLIFALLGLFVAVEAAARPMQQIESRPRELLIASLSFAGRYWDDDAALLRSPVPGDPGRLHRTRESAWYALGLLMRDTAGDKAQAIRIVERVLGQQFDAPGQPWDGTFARVPEDPLPVSGAQLWKHFDPNWRQFIGTTFVLILEQFGRDLPAPLCAKMEHAIRRAVESELKEGRDEAYHTNIALMHAFLLNWAGTRFQQSEWVTQSHEWAKKIHEGFARHGTFEEYNSPTYYGVDLYSLALWRRYGATELLRATGRELEMGLWRDIAQFYHAGLLNLCGPFDRAYGLDMASYVSLTGIWIGLVQPAKLTPLPDPGGPMPHGHDFFVTPAYVALGAAVPDDVMPALSQFSGERSLERVITDDRKVTAWLGADLMLGGEATQLTRESGPGTTYGQFHPATAHWRVGGSHVGAIALVQSPAVNATAEPYHLRITTKKGASRFRVSAPGMRKEDVARALWILPEMRVEIVTDAADFRIEPGEGYVDLVYRDATGFDLRFSRTP